MQILHKGQPQRSRKKIHTIRVYPKMWAPIAGKVGASAAEKWKETRQGGHEKKEEWSRKDGILMYVTKKENNANAKKRMRKAREEKTQRRSRRSALLRARQAPALVRGYLEKMLNQRGQRENRWLQVIVNEVEPVTAAVGSHRHHVLRVKYRQVWPRFSERRLYKLVEIRYLSPGAAISRRYVRSRQRSLPNHIWSWAPGGSVILIILRNNNNWSEWKLTKSKYVG